MATVQDELHFSPRPNRAHEIGWRPWSADAFADAQREDKPILLSISAVWCHWCHVMDETTYSAQPVIDAINAEYIPIRVDNDVRPDINQRYNMGGWPTTAFLTPRGEILTGATYLPPEQMLDALTRIASVYRTQRPQIAAKVLEGRKRAAGALAAQAGSLDAALVDRVLGAVEGSYDPVHGGFGTAPKFPQTEALLLLAEQAILRDEPELMQMARHTLESMASGGTYDHVEGGFFRYSTTPDWSVPHFEKMLEDHAGLVSALAATRLESTLDDASGYLDRVLRDPATGMYAGSQDADEHYYSLDAEGRGKLEPPYVDRRVYTAWNCALAAAYIDAHHRLNRPRLLENAERSLASIFARRWHDDAGLEHVDGIRGQLGDQVWGLLACVKAAGSGFDDDWGARARRLAELLEHSYADERLGGYFDTAEAGPGRLDERVKPLPENSIAAIGLLELDTLLGDPTSKYRDSARRALESVAALPRQYGLLAAVYARALDRWFHPPVKVTTADQRLAAAALDANPYCVIEHAGDARAIVCVGTECFAPVTAEAEVRELVTANRQPVG